MASRPSAFGFHPVIDSWFQANVGQPTDVQRLAWPAIAAGKHVLVTAPTGSGKTLAAFLWALQCLYTRAYPPGRVSVLYVSPLKALNNDVRRNLLVPLQSLDDAFRAASVDVPPVTVLTRSGDTPSDERQRMVRRPPSILITTPESLNVLLTSERGRTMLQHLRAVILDEVHAVYGGKRGVHLMTAVERLAALAGEFQRIALSATIRPMQHVARWVGGHELIHASPQPSYRARSVQIIQAPGCKRYEVAVRAPYDGNSGDGDALWSRVVREIRQSIEGRRSVLVFANSRRMVEKLARLVNEGQSQELAYAHHGSLSRQVRAVVEERLKSGAIRSIIATNSLELGIDIGSLDEVLLVQTPPSVASAIQRVGRAGHAVGEVSRGRFIPLVPMDIIRSAVVAKALSDGELEREKPVLGALDVLAQVIVSMVATQQWHVDELYATIRCAEAYQSLSRWQFDKVLDMLAGRYASIRVRELRPVITVDGDTGMVRGRSGADRLVYLSSGTIPDRGYYRLRREDSAALIGELDEEFVWERAVGDAFTLGVQTWRITKVTHNDVFVRPERRGGAMAPFWRADERDRGFELSQRIGQFLESVEQRGIDGGLVTHLRDQYLLDEPTAEQLVHFLQLQRMAAGNVLPHRHRLVVEHVRSAGNQVTTILHTLWGGKVNRPLAVAMRAAWSETWPALPVEVMSDDDCISLTTTEELRAGQLLKLVSPESLQRHLRAGLEHTGFFGARFRLAAARSLLLPRAGFHQRTPLWLSRARAKKLLEAVAQFDDFPILLEAWRECLQDEFDLAALEQVLSELESGEIEVAEVVTSSPSPFAANVTWKQTNDLMYADDTPDVAGPSRLRSDLLRETVFSANLRPRIARSLVEQFERKAQRLEVGWSPRGPEELLDWVIERLVIPAGEWQRLHEAIDRDSHGAWSEWIAQAAPKLVWMEHDQGSFVCARDHVNRLAGALGAAGASLRLAPMQPQGLPSAFKPKRVKGGTADELPEVLAELLRFYGPVTQKTLQAMLGVEAGQLDDAIEQLADAQRLVLDEITDDASEPQVCDAENLERLLRIMRAGARKGFEPLPPQCLPLLFAVQQGLGRTGGSPDELQAALDPLLGFACPADLWEAEVLPARMEVYQPRWLDALVAETGLLWVGSGDKKVSFVLEHERELIGSVPSAAQDDKELEPLFPHASGRYSLEELVRHTGASSEDLTRRLWKMAWQGQLTNDTMAALRAGVDSGFEPVEVQELAAGIRIRRAQRDRWRSSRPFAGGWRQLPAVHEPADAVERDELARERVRLLLERWGVLFRELLAREVPALQWSSVFRALRLMELAGEVVAGQFFDGVPGLQFASSATLRKLMDGLPREHVYWMSAADPASPCGLGIIEGLPRRLPVHHVVFRGSQLVVVSERHAHQLSIRADVNDPRLPEYLRFMRVLLSRQVRPLRSLTVERINDEPAASSDFRGVLAAMFHVTRDRTSLRLSTRYDAAD